MELDRFDPREPVLLPAELEAVRELFGAHNAVLYDPEPRESGWDVEFSAWAGADAESRRRAHQALVRSAPLDTPNFAAYDPFAVEPHQRNRALTIRDIVKAQPSASDRHRRVWAAIDARKEDELRVLVCRGPRLLGWFGVVREEPFAPADVRALQALAEPVRRRLLAERACRQPGGERSLVEAVLEAVPEPCLVLGARARIEYANRAALELCDGSEAQRATIAALRDAVVNGRAHPDFTCTSLDARGCPGFVLAVYTGAAAQRSAAVARACRAWKIGGARAAVLERLAEGGSNKEIAAALGTTEVSVERHVTALFRASGARSRTELVARLFGLAAARPERP